MRTSKKLFAPVLLALYCGIQSNFSFANILYPDPSMNVNIGTGDYFFAGLHPGMGQPFLDQFQFSLQGTGSVQAAVFNSSIEPPNFPATDPKLVNNSVLLIGLFDSSGNLISAAGNGSVLTATGLSAGTPYTVAVLGQTSGIFGGAYTSELKIDDPVAAVPLPAAFPVFLSALLTLGWRQKKASAEVS